MSEDTRNFDSLQNQNQDRTSPGGIRRTTEEKGKWKEGHHPPRLPTIESDSESDSFSKVHLPTPSKSDDKESQAGNSLDESDTEDYSQVHAPTPHDSDDDFVATWDGFRTRADSVESARYFGVAEGGHAGPWSPATSDTAPHMSQGQILPPRRDLNPHPMSRNGSFMTSPSSAYPPIFASDHTPDEAPPHPPHPSPHDEAPVILPHPDGIPQHFLQDTQTYRPVVRLPNGQFVYADQLQYLIRPQIPVHHQNLAQNLEQVRPCPFSLPVDYATSTAGSSREAGESERLSVFMPSGTVVGKRQASDEEQKEPYDTLYREPPAPASFNSMNDQIEVAEKKAGYINEPKRVVQTLGEAKAKIHAIEKALEEDKKATAAGLREERRVESYIEQTKRRYEEIRKALAEEDKSTPGTGDKIQQSACYVGHEGASTLKGAEWREKSKRKQGINVDAETPTESSSSSSRSTGVYSTVSAGSSEEEGKERSESRNNDSHPAQTPYDITPQLISNNAAPLPRHFQQHFSNVTGTLADSYKQAIEENSRDRTALMDEMKIARTPLVRQRALSRYIDKCHKLYGEMLRLHGNVLECLAFGAKSGVHLVNLSLLVAEIVKFSRYLTQASAYCHGALKTVDAYAAAAESRAEAEQGKRALLDKKTAPAKLRKSEVAKRKARESSKAEADAKIRKSRKAETKARRAPKAMTASKATLQAFRKTRERSRKGKDAYKEAGKFSDLRAADESWYDSFTETSSASESESDADDSLNSESGNDQGHQSSVRLFQGEHTAKDAKKNVVIILTVEEKDPQVLEDIRQSFPPTSVMIEPQPFIIRVLHPLFDKAALDLRMIHAKSMWTELVLDEDIEKQGGLDMLTVIVLNQDHEELGRWYNVERVDSYDCESQRFIFNTSDEAELLRRFQAALKLDGETGRPYNLSSWLFRGREPYMAINKFIEGKCNGGEDWLLIDSLRQMDKNSVFVMSGLSAENGPNPADDALFIEAVRRDLPGKVVVFPWHFQLFMYCLKLSSERLQLGVDPKVPELAYVYLDISNLGPDDVPAEECYSIEIKTLDGNVVRNWDNVCAFYLCDDQGKLGQSYPRTGVVEKYEKYLFQLMQAGKKVEEGIAGPVSIGGSMPIGRSITQDRYSEDTERDFSIANLSADLVEDPNDLEASVTGPAVFQPDGKFNVFLRSPFFNLSVPLNKHTVISMKMIAREPTSKDKEVCFNMIQARNLENVVLEHWNAVQEISLYEVNEETQEESETIFNLHDLNQAACEYHELMAESGRSTMYDEPDKLPKYRSQHSSDGGMALALEYDPHTEQITHLLEDAPGAEQATDDDNDDRYLTVPLDNNVGGIYFYCEACDELLEIEGRA